MKLLAISIAAVAVFSAPAAQATLITFEGFSNAERNAPINRLGFLIGNVAGQEQHFHEITSTNFGLPNNGTGVLLNDRATQIFVTGALGEDFSLSAVDVATALSNRPAAGLQIEGFNDGVSTGVLSLASLGLGYTSMSGSGLGNVDRLLFTGLGGAGGFVLDNLDLGAAGATGHVPEPASVALVLAALGLAAGARRARKA